MANSSEAGEEDAVSDGLKEWAKINRARFIGESSPTGWPLVGIREISAACETMGDTILFPPINHENLHASPNPINHHCIPPNAFKSPCSSPSQPSPLESSSSSSSSRSQFGVENDDWSYSFPPSEFPPSEPEKSLPCSPNRPVKSPFGSASWWNCGLKVLLSRFSCIEQHFRFISTAPWTISSFLSLIGRSKLAAVIVIFLCFRWRRRLNRRGETREELIRTIAQKDQMIIQLMNQMAEMNQLILALHRKGHHLSNT
ncbi:hypothetical protein DM860_011727 [Cuscuta australis]|uniref:Uncharacterized protein n=1 Tax=Cuscuta australis TaxID=267555 RepID=A0A328DGT4_9ASTE|nr:hypothetical protein DM860_011727 [Cuscuta australis]